MDSGLRNPLACFIFRFLTRPLSFSLSQYKSCLSSERPQKLLELDKTAAQQAGVRATPTVITATQRHGGFRTEADFAGFLERQ
jgi:predicted DsbA family dithiol-disulfide isomerase